MTPKSLLRHSKVVSTLEELAQGHFKELIEDPRIKTKSKVKKLIFLSGKLYYDIDKQREEKMNETHAIVRLEQLYPLAEKQIKKLVQSYKNLEQIIWAQEEPHNMGAAYFVKMNFPVEIDKIISPAASASPAPGSARAFATRQKELVEKILNA
ncbi:MAG: hypothetical protein U5L96_17140 [Owenweeksia sp.]|nr:hypothetical protein [Owenweeksia sp.]